jgi:hypothetical protein
MKINEAEFRELVDFDKYDRDVQERLSLLANEYNSGNPLPFLKFMNNYVSWNGYFALGVTALTTAIGVERDLFRDRELSIHLDCAADRSNYVASFVFDAARDEFNDSNLPQRAPHRTLSQALMLRLGEIYGERFDLNHYFKETTELKYLNKDVITGYLGQRFFAAAPSQEKVFAGMGYHASSEIFADAEFTALDNTIKTQMPDLFSKLYKNMVKITDKELDAYHWIRVHSGHGSAVEQAHFALALRSIQKALEYTPEDQHATCINAVKFGFKLFASDHSRFFQLKV